MSDKRFIEEFHDKIALICEDEKWGYVDWCGARIVPCQFEREELVNLEKFLSDNPEYISFFPDDHPVFKGERVELLKKYVQDRLVSLMKRGHVPDEDLLKFHCADRALTVKTAVPTSGKCITVCENEKQ